MTETTKPQTPLMQQYWSIKSAHPDKVLFFRMGDFYEMFFEDAVTAAPVIGIALTSRNKKAADETPMCGLPHHAVAGPINKLLAKGFKVALCDQIEDPKLAKGIVKRAVTRILTPGMVYDYNTLNPQQSNYLGCYEEGALSCVEPSTGDCLFFRSLSEEECQRMMEILGVVELILPSPEPESDRSSAQILTSFKGTRSIHGSLQTTALITAPKISKTQAALPQGAHRLLSYLESISKAEVLAMLRPFRELQSQGRMELSSQTLRHLEIFKTFSGEEEGGFFAAIDRTKTSSGSRRLRQKIAFPLIDEAAIQAQLDELAAWMKDSFLLTETRAELGRLGDLERRLTRIGQTQSSARDLLLLAEGIEKGLDVLRAAKVKENDPEASLALAALADGLKKHIVEDPPLAITQGGMIRKGITESLDEQIDLSSNGQEILLQMEAREREATGISSLKIRFNGVFGYYIEVTNSHLTKVPDRFMRKQTLAGAERFSTPELVELEQKILSAQARRSEIELQIFQDLKKRVLDSSQQILGLALECSELDVQTSLAYLALERSYVRPTFTKDRGLSLKAARHPVVEQKVQQFIPNDIDLGTGDCLLLTGPNMAGKSTLMRQVALIQIMAQIGSYVPCASAQLPVCEQIFTRIGASDNLAQGLSTFMVEMTETAEMIKNAGPKALLILDEVGRGTSTYDGLSLAQALLEHFLKTKVSSIFFATHYHELTKLSDQFSQIKNAHMSVIERKNEIQFLHTLKSGPAQKSYGIQVARLAGVPKSVIDRANEILRTLEVIGPKQLSIFDRVEESPELTKGPTFSPEMQLALKAIKEFQLERTTPLDAMMKIREWQQSLD